MSRRREGIVPDVSSSPMSSTPTVAHACTHVRTFVSRKRVYTLFACNVRHYRTDRVCVVGSSHRAPVAPCVRNELDHHGIVSRHPGLGFGFRYTWNLHGKRTVNVIHYSLFETDFPPATYRKINKFSITGHRKHFHELSFGDTN